MSWPNGILTSEEKDSSNTRTHDLGTRVGVGGKVLFFWDTTLEKEGNFRLYSEASTLEAYFSLAQGLCGRSLQAKKLFSALDVQRTWSTQSQGFQDQINSTDSEWH